MKKLLLTILLACLVGAGIDCDAAKRKRKKAAPVKTETKAKTSKELRQEKTRNAREIEQTRKQIKSNETETRRQLSRLSLLDAEIRIQDAALKEISRKVDSISESVKQLTDSVNATEARAASLRKSYGENLRAIRAQRQGMSEAAFIFSAGSFSKMYRRMRYLGELRDWQKQRETELKTISAKLTADKERLSAEQAKLTASKAKLDTAARELAASRQEATGLVASLKKEGSGLRKILKDKQDRARRLDAELDRVIAEEARKAAEEEKRRKEKYEAERRLREEAKRKAAGESAANTPAAKPAEKPKKEEAPQEGRKTWALSESFVSNKGRLPAPVDGSFTVASNFGRSSHPEMSRIEIQNNGIDLSTPSSAKVKAVFNGTVSSIFQMDGYSNIVIIRHGEYLTVYAGVENLAVRKGEDVYTGKALGTVAKDPDDPSRGLLHFELRREKAKLNPADWLKLR